MEVGIAVIHVRIWTKVVDGGDKTKRSLRNFGDIKLPTLGNVSDMGVGTVSRNLLDDLLVKLDGLNPFWIWEIIK